MSLKQAALKIAATQSGEMLITPRMSNNVELNRRESILAAPPQSAKLPLMQTSSGSQAAGSDISLDQKLVSRVKQGDKTAFDLLVIKYQGKVASIVSRYISDYHEIADVTQEAFIKAYRAIHKFRGDSAFYTWLYRIAINCAKNYLVSKSRRPPASDIDASEAEHSAAGIHFNDISSPESELHKEQVEKTVKTALSALPEDLRVALTLREFDGLSYDDIADVMGCPVGTVRSRIFRAREAIDEAIRALGKESDNV